MALDTPSPMRDDSRADQRPPVSPKKRLSFPIREPSLTIKKKGTVFHDDKLAKSQGTYRQPSLRRGSGVAYQTPEVFGRVASEKGQSV
jgi:hypothetical protein